MKKQLLQVIFALAIMTGTVYAQQPGSLDATFNGKGIKTFSFGTNTQSENVTASYLQPDGKLLVAMTSSAGGPFDTTSYVARFMADGSPDLSFGTGGKKEMDSKFLFGGYFYFVPYAFALQDDGTIVVGGVRRNLDQNTACIVSLKPNGDFNELFNNGLACTVLGEDGNIIKSLSIHKKTGNIWACGTNTNYNNRGFFICDVNRTGQALIGDGGQVYGNYFPEGVYDEYATSSVIKGDILYMGGTVRSFENRKHLGIMAINVNNGSKASGFFDDGEGTTGTITIPIPPEVPAGSTNECTALRFSPDSNSLFLGGYSIDTNNVTDVNFMLAKVNLKNGGYIDTLFSADGISTYKMAGTTQNYLRALSIDASGKMMMGGTLASGSLSYWTALRVLPNGNIDNSFGTAGRKVYDGNNGNSLINSFNLVGLHYNTSSKNYVLTGHYQGTTNLDGLAKRITYKGDADNSFGTSSQIIFSGKEDNAILRDVSVRGDGKMIICGVAQNADDGDNMIALLNADGSQDKTFGTINLATLVPSLPEAKIMDIEVLSNNKILVAGYYMNTVDSMADVFVLRLKDNGALDTDFNSVGYFINNLSPQNDFGQGIALRSDGAIILYGYRFNGEAFNPVVLQLSADGILNTSFGSGGVHIYPEEVPGVDGFFKQMDAKVRPDGKILVTTYHDNGSNADVMVYRLTATGALDTGFGAGGSFIGDYGFEAAQYPYAIALTSDDKIVVAGQNSDEGGNNNMLVMLNEDGTLDTTFATSGWLILNKSSDSEAFSYVTVTNNKIVATGLVLKYNPVTDGDDSYFTAARFTLNGLLDNTFANRGYTIIGQSYSFNSLVSNNKLYFIGADRKLDGQTIYKGMIGRINLGTGPVVKVTNLQAIDYNKFLGDAPFLITPVTNSPGPKTYTVSSSAKGCVSVNPTSGLVTMTCATVNSSPVTIQIIQAATAGFTADTAYSTINVGKGIPKITFNPQGDTLTSTFTIQVSSTSDSYPQFNAVGDDYNAIYLNGDGTAYANEEGCTDVQVYYYETDNYLEGYATTSICAQVHLIPPAAFDDDVTLAYPVEGPVYISPLANDEAYTGTISPAGLDLDPATPGIQRSYTSPALGRFDADSTTGVVTFTSFEGLVGSGSIDYVVYDSKGSASPKSKINVSVVTTADVSALKATELFTPNNDGLNDAFVIGYVNLDKENQLKIFDRNGQELFTKNNYQNDWKGELTNGKTAENGIYYYTFTENDGNKTRELKGSVELRR